MQKSMVHELNPFVTSIVHTGRSSFIHTTHETDFNQLRKSRIQNLPNYRRQDLSGKLNFVVVFQAIEIQRLSLEIQTLRIKIKDNERQIGNYENYEVQIRQLTEKCHSYEIQRQDHQQAMEKMHKICQQLYNELQQMRARYADIDLSLKQKYRLQKEKNDLLSSQIDKWRQRCQAIENSKARQLEDMRAQMQTQRKSILQKQLRQMALKYETQRTGLQSEIRKQRQLNESMRMQLLRLRQQLQQSHIREGELRQYETRLDEYEDKLMMMAQENMRLNQLLRMKKQEIQQLKNNERNLLNKLEMSSKLQQQIQILKKKIQQYEIEIRDLTQKHSRLEAENGKNLILAAKAQQYERLLDNSAQEMEKMNGIIREKISHIDQLKANNQRLIVEVEDAHKKGQKIDEYEKRIQQAENENDRLNQQLKNRLGQLQSFKNKYAEIQSKLPQLAQAQNECKALKEKLAFETSSRNKLSETISAMQKDLNKAAELQQTFMKQKAINKDLQKEIQRLNSSIKNLSVQNNDMSRKLQSLQTQLRQNSTLMQQLQKCKRTINMMTQQLDRINGLIHEKIQQLKQLRENYNTVSINTTRFKQIQEQFMANLEQTEKLVLKIDQYRRQNQLLNDKLLAAQTKTKKLQSQLFQNNQQKDKLIAIVNQKKVQLQDLMIRMGKMDDKLIQLQAVEQQHNKLKITHNQLEQKLKDLEIRFNKQTKRSQQLSNEIQRQVAQIQRLRTQSNFTKQFISQFMTLKAISQQKDSLISSLIDRMMRVEKCLDLVKRQAKRNYAMACQKEQKWQQINLKLQLMSEWMARFVEMQQRIDQLTEENFRLEGNMNQLSIQMTTSQYTSPSYSQSQETKITVSSPIVVKERTGKSSIILSPLNIEEANGITRKTMSTSPKPIHSPSNKLATIDEDYSKQSSRKTYDNTSQELGNSSTLMIGRSSYSNDNNNLNNNINNNNYYQSQVREYEYTSSYQPTSSSLYTSNINPTQQISSNSGLYQRPSSSIVNSSNIMIKRMSRPSSTNEEKNTTYGFTSSVYSNNTPPYTSSSYNIIGSPKTINNNQALRMNSGLSPTNDSFMNKFGSTVSNNSYSSSIVYNNTPFTPSDQQTTFAKQTNRYSVTNAQTTTPDGKQQYQDPRKNMHSPVRYL